MGTEGQRLWEGASMGKRGFCYIPQEGDKKFHGEQYVKLTEDFIPPEGENPGLKSVYYLCAGDWVALLADLESLQDEAFQSVMERRILRRADDVDLGLLQEYQQTFELPDIMSQVSQLFADLPSINNVIWKVQTLIEIFRKIEIVPWFDDIEESIVIAIIRDHLAEFLFSEFGGIPKTEQLESFLSASETGTDFFAELEQALAENNFKTDLVLSEYPGKVAEFAIIAMEVFRREELQQLLSLPLRRKHISLFWNTVPVERISQVLEQHPTILDEIQQVINDGIIGDFDVTQRRNFNEVARSLKMEIDQIRLQEMIPLLEEEFIVEYAHLFTETDTIEDIVRVLTANPMLLDHIQQVLETDIRFENFPVELELKEIARVLKELIMIASF